eukprot:3815272-Rhodomonas_salina.1
MRTAAASIRHMLLWNCEVGLEDQNGWTGRQVWVRVRTQWRGKGKGFPSAASPVQLVSCVSEPHRAYHADHFA